MNRKQPGPRARPYRPCLQRQSQAIVTGKFTAKPHTRCHKQKRRPSSLCRARHRESWERRQQQELLPSTQAAKEQDRVQRRASSAHPHKHRDSRGLTERWKHRHVPLRGALRGLAALLDSRTHLRNTAQNKLGANWCMGWAGVLEAGELLLQPCT